MDQDLENPKVGEVGLDLANLLYMALSLYSAFQSLKKTRRGLGVGCWWEGEELASEFLGFGPSLVLAINENAWTAQSTV